MQAKETQPYLRAGGVKIEVAVDSSLRHDEILQASKLGFRGVPCSWKEPDALLLGLLGSAKSPFRPGP